MWYLLIFAAVVMFGGQFFFNARYQTLAGSTVAASLTFSALTGLFGLTGLFLINGLSLSVTPFTLGMAVWAALNNLAFSYCAIRSLGRINLSVFSVFSMIGGMLLPFAAGLLAFSEFDRLAGKCLCLLFIAAGMLTTVRRQEEKGAWKYYLGVFIFNGMSGVLSMIYTNADLPKGSAADYSILSAAVRILIAAVWLAFLLRKKKFSLEKRAILDAAAYGVLNATANWLLLIALIHVDGSMQYPLVTGGVMVVSTVIGYFTAKKPTKKDVLAVGLSMAGMLCMLLPF